MTTELNLSFASPDKVIVSFDNRGTEAIAFKNPLTDEDREQIRWYLEKYPVLYTADIDDDAAAKVENKLPEWGEKLFDAVFDDRSAQRLFNDFQDSGKKNRLITISSAHPEILSLPWELLKDPKGTYVLHEQPRISVRRNLSGAGGGREPFKVKAKKRLNLLFVVSRPKGARFLDPRSDPQAVLDALEKHAEFRVDAEFLRPATIDKLVERLEDDSKPPIDILHFDGHGVFDADGNLNENAKTPSPSQDTGLTKKDDTKTANMGYLLFEDNDGAKALISAEKLGNMLHRKQVGLIVLSACQSAKIAGDDPMGSVAARLTHAGIPAVIAMTHSVLVDTTRALFGSFYKHLAQGKAMGESLDNARRDLWLHPERGERRRGMNTWITMKLQDWFLPALYQCGKDTPMLTAKAPALPSEESAPRHNLNTFQEAGFFGRAKELWDIEKAFVSGTRRLTISGFGGQGKTYLATEAGNWLCRARMFDYACFVSFANYQGVDPVSFAVSTLATVLNQSLIDEKAAAKALGKFKTLMILDNLESLTHPFVPSQEGNAHPNPSQEGNNSPLLGGAGVGSLNELLNAAKIWSEAGDSRVLLTTRQPEFHHADYPVANSRKHIRMMLKGLTEDDAVRYFQAIMKLPPEPEYKLPERAELIKLFYKVDLHPLSVGLLAQQLKVRSAKELGERLEALLKQMPDDTPDKSLMASLNLSLERMPESARKFLPRLGVFQGGAMESVILNVTEFSQEQWQALRPALENTGLIQAENLQGVSVPYLRFHPTLSPALWQKLSVEEKEELSARHRAQYYRLSGWMYHEDKRNPFQVREIVKRELPNLMAGVRGALEKEEEDAVEFVEYVNRFLNVFGLSRDREELTRRAELLAKTDEKSWYLARSNLGEQLFDAGRFAEAEQIFSEILAKLGQEPSYERCVTLHLLGRCLRFQRQSAQAEEMYRQGLAVAEKLEASQYVKRQMGLLQTDLADVLTDIGSFDEARAAYQAALAIAEEQNDNRQVAVVNTQLGTLAMLQGNLQEAVQRYQEALGISHQLNEPAMQATAWNLLGVAFMRAKQWEAAEGAYRESARIKENRGDLAGAALAWNNLALVTESAGKPDQAEGWYRKAIEANKKNRIELSKILSNLANLLQNKPSRLQEARQLAEEALVIKKTIDPGAAEIWTTYTILAQIADKQHQPEQARDYRRQAREAKANFAGTRYELQKYEPIIAAIVAAAQGHEDAKQFVRQEQEKMRSVENWRNFADATDRILSGERNEEALCENLYYDHAVIVMAILERIGV
jgi:tetratricopeptide (TPR) repeat protein